MMPIFMVIKEFPFYRGPNTAEYDLLYYYNITLHFIQPNYRGYKFAFFGVNFFRIDTVTQTAPYQQAIIKYTARKAQNKNMEQHLFDLAVKRHCTFHIHINSHIFLKPFIFPSGNITHCTCKNQFMVV